MNRSVDFNADVGEGFDDTPLFEVVTSANIACGLHAGNVDTMRRAVRAALAYDVAIGAHPSFDDRASFGRSAQTLAAPAVVALVTQQLEALARIADREGGRVRHVKPHGALYNQAASDAALAQAIATAVAAFDARLVLVGRSGGALLDAGRAAGLGVLSEVFADRLVEADGSLTARTIPGAVITDAALAAERALRMVQDGKVSARDGRDVAVVADTLCIHGDTDGAIAVARRVREALERAGIRVAAAESR